MPEVPRLLKLAADDGRMNRLLIEKKRPPEKQGDVFFCNSLRGLHFCQQFFGPFVPVSITRSVGYLDGFI